MSTLENLNTIIECKRERLSEIHQQVSIIDAEIDSLAASSTDEDIKNMLQKALVIANTRQELNVQKEVLTKAAAITQKELAALAERLQEAEVEHSLRQLREVGERCNETLELLKRQFREIKRISAKLSTLPVKRPPLTHNYRANLPKLKILETVIVVEEDLRSSLDSIQIN